jgi:hypothetical protein
MEAIAITTHMEFLFFIIPGFKDSSIDFVQSASTYKTTWVHLTLPEFEGYFGCFTDEELTGGVTFAGSIVEPVSDLIVLMISEVF